MPSTPRRAFLAAAAAGIAGCSARLPVGDDAGTTEPADRRVPTTYRPASDEWLRPTRSFANDVVSPTASPPRERPEERWTAPTPGPVHAVVVADGVVYAGSRDGAVAVDLEDGERRWAVDHGRWVSVVDGRCYAVSDDAIYALEAETGDEAWRYELDDVVYDLLEVDGTVYCVDRNGLYGLHADTGEFRWLIEADVGRYSALARYDGELHWVTRKAYRTFVPDGPARPEERTAITLDGFASPTSPTAPAIAEGTIALGGRGTITHGDAAVRTLSSRGVIWHRPFEPAVTTPAILEDRLLVTGYDNGSDALDESAVAALDRETGDPIWETTVSEPVGPPAVGDGLIYVGGAHPSEPAEETGHLFALEAETGDLRWELETDGSFAGHPLALVEDVIVLGTRQGVVVLE